LSDRKKLGGGEGRLTDKLMNTMQNYYGIAIHQTDNIYAMKKLSSAIVFNIVPVRAITRNVTNTVHILLLHGANTKETR